MKSTILLNLFIILGLTVYMNEIILTHEVFYHSLGDQLSEEQIQSVLGMSKRMVWFDYLWTVTWYLIKIIIISALVYLILYLNNIKVFYSDITEIVSESFTIFLLPMIIKTIMLTISADSITLDYMQTAPIGSLLDFFDSHGMENWLKVTLRGINIWEIIFIAILGNRLKKYFNNDYWKSVNNVIVSYGGGLLCWMFFVAFISITISQN